MKSFRTINTTLVFLISAAIVDKGLSFQIQTPPSVGKPKTPALQSSASVDVAVTSKCPFSSFVQRTSNVLPRLDSTDYLTIAQRQRRKTFALTSAMVEVADQAKRRLLLALVWVALKTRHFFQQDNRPPTKEAPTDIVRRLGDLHSVEAKDERTLRKALARKLGSTFMYNVFVAITDKSIQALPARGIFQTFMVHGFAPKTGRSVESALGGPHPLDVKHSLDLLSYVQSTAIGFEHIFEDAASGKYNKPEAGKRLARIHGRFGIPQEQFIRFLEIIEETTVTGLDREAYEGDRERQLVGETVGLFNTQFVREGLGVAPPLL